MQTTEPEIDQPRSDSQNVGNCGREATHTCNRGVELDVVVDEDSMREKVFCSRCSVRFKVSSESVLGTNI